MCPRPRHHRRMGNPPEIKGMKPFGGRAYEMEEVSLLFEEYESIKLADYKNMTQEEASKIMNISRPTFTRIYEKARQKVAQAIVENKVLLIEGGNIEFDKNWFRCNDCGIVFSSEKEDKITCPKCKSKDIESINKSLDNWKSRGRGSSGMQTTKQCACPKCGKTIAHKRGIPCVEEICPNCKSNMRVSI